MIKVEFYGKKKDMNMNTYEIKAKDRKTRTIEANTPLNAIKKAYNGVKVEATKEKEKANIAVTLTSGKSLRTTYYIGSNIPKDRDIKPWGIEGTFEYNTIRDNLIYCPDEPTYKFNIGDPVVIGSLQDCVISNVYEDGRVYEITYTNVKNNYGKCIYEPNQIIYRFWLDIRPKVIEDHNLIKNKDYKLDYSQRDIGGLLTHIYDFGTDTSPSYQREYVWNLEDKEALIDSIFHNIDIGKFVFVGLGNYGVGEYGYEILDGKQRLKAITDFYENRFTYKGLYYNDLSIRERDHFKKYNISFATLNDPDEETKYRTFILLNTKGKSVDVTQIDRVKELYKQTTGHDID